MTSTKTSPKTFIENIHWAKDSPNVGYHNTQDWKLSTAWKDTTTGTGNPYWQKKIKNGQDATTLRTGAKATYSSNGSFKSEYSYIGNDLQRKFDGKESVSGFPWAPSIPVPTTLGYENVTKSASLSFLRDVKSATTAVASGVILGELKQTIRQIRSPAHSIRQLISRKQSSAYNKYRNITARDAAKVAADTWLEIRLGLLPLLSDSIAIGEAIKRVAIKREFKSVSGYSEEERTIPPTEITSYYCNSSYLSAVGTLERKEKVSCRFRGSVSLETSWNGSIREQFGILPEDFVPTLWELVPWSFVIDYFADIGGWLNAASVATSQIRWSCGTTRSETSEVRKAHASSTHPDVLSVHGAGKSSASYVTFSRGYVNPGLPWMPEIRLPGTIQSFNILALMLANKKMWPNLR